MLADGEAKTTKTKHTTATPCKKPSCPTLKPCPRGMKVETSRCQCPKCTCKKVCNSDLRNCTQCIGGTTIYDACGCTCPLCKP